jgi:hypothetical protein
MIIARLILLRAPCVAKECLERLAIHQGACDVEARPVLGPFDQPLFGAVAENVFQARDLGFLFGADGLLL